MSDSLWLYVQACQAPLAVGVSRQEHGSGLPCPPPAYLPWSRDRTQVSCISRWVLCVFAVTSAVFDSLRPYGLEPTRLLCPSDSPGKNTGLSCHVLLQGIFPTQGLNCVFCDSGIAGGLLYCRDTREAQVQIFTTWNVHLLCSTWNIWRLQFSIKHSIHRK